MARAAAAIAERPSSGTMPECAGRPWKRTDERALVGRAHDHVADRRRLVVDEAQLGLELRVVEGARAEQADLLLLREQKLDAGVRLALGDDPPSRLDHRDDGRLVVRAEDGSGGVSDDPVRDDGLEGALRRHGVEVRTEEDRRPAVEPAGKPAQQVARVGVDALPGVVLLDLERPASAARRRHDR